MGSVGYTHFNKLSGINGVFTGKRGEEKPIPTVGAVSTVVTTVGDVYIASPIAGSLTGYANFSVSAGTGRLITVLSGATEILKSAVTGANGTVGVSVALGVESSAALDAGTALRVTAASCATAQGDIGVTIVFTPAIVG